MIKIPQDILTREELERISGMKEQDINIEIPRVYLEKESLTLVVGVKLNFVIPRIHEKRMRDRILKKVGQAKDVRFRYAYQTSEAPAAKKASDKSKGSKKPNVSGGVLYGTYISGEPIPIEEIYGKVGERGQVVIRGELFSMDSRAIKNGKLLVQGVDLLDQKRSMKEADMVVLAAAIEPNPDVRKIATMLTASIDTNNFLTEAHPKLRPVESPTAGVFLSGVCQGPKDIPETVAQAGAAAVKAIGLLAKDKLKTNPCTAKPDELVCSGCSVCANVCPYGAITYIEKEVRDHGIREVRRLASVNSALCQGCGACTVACPSGAMDLQGFSNRQLIAEVDAICK